MRSITRSYFGGSSNLTPSSLMYSATTSPRLCSLMPLIIASGKVFSRPTRIPTRFICVYVSFRENQAKYPRLCSLSNRHPHLRLWHPCNSHGGQKGFFTGMCYNPLSMQDFPRLAPTSKRRSEFKENG